MRNIFRIEVYSKIFDARSLIRKKALMSAGYRNIKSLRIADVYTVDKLLKREEFQKYTRQLVNPVTQKAVIFLSSKSYYHAEILKLLPVVRILSESEEVQDNWDWVIEVGYLPGVTDNIATTAKEMLEDLLKIKFKDNEGLYSSQITFISGKFNRSQAQKIALSLANPLIHRIHIKNFSEYQKDGGMDLIIPKVKLKNKVNLSEVDLNVTDEKLATLGKEGIFNPDGTRRGPLVLSLPYMKVIQAYFKKKGRNPTDIELETLAQTWSEHCKHTIFADPIDEIKEGLFKYYIKRTTEEIRKEKGKKDKCISVFRDNSGAIVFNDNYLITHKVETHNTPSALDPFGGAITGIVGVNRDTIGFGLGAKPIANYYGFCLADPRVDIPLYKGPSFAQKMLSSRRIMDGVIEGVNSGGNQSGIPTPQGFLYFDERYRGKPLVFVGTIGLIPKKIKGRSSYIKKAKPGDYIVMVGGRVGKDGIHGATFSSEALSSDSPVTAVQIGDPITQKKLSDVLIKEARDLLLYNSITDNGAGGLSCSVAEMAKEGKGCFVNLDKVPLKYPGLAPWEIWISESQERMTLAVPKKKWEKLFNLLRRRGVEATIIGEFTNSGKCEVIHQGKTIMDIDLQFLHYGLPKRSIKTVYIQKVFEEPIIPKVKDLTKSFLSILGRLNIAGFEFISQQYDYMVQGNLILGPLQGRGRVNGETSVIRPVLDSPKGIIISYGLYPSYSDIDTYHMAACGIDTAIRNIVTTGGNIEEIYLLDNFCWCSSDDPYRLGQLKRATKACYDFATFYNTPFISGKDSMFNDFVGFDNNGKKVKISIPPTLLITSFGVIDDVLKVVSLDAKQPGDLIYLLGETYEELGASEYFAMYSDQKDEYIGNNVAKVDAKKNLKLYQTFSKAIQNSLIASSISIGRGGLSVALAKMAMGGMLGFQVSLINILGKVERDDYALFSESQGRVLVTISPENKRKFERTMKGSSFSFIGKVLQNKSFIIKGLKGNVIVNTSVGEALKSYRKTFKWY